MERSKRVAHCAKEAKYAHFFLPPISFRVLSQPSVKKSRAETSIGAIFRNLPSPVRATQVGTKRYAILRNCRQPHSRCQCWAQGRRVEGERPSELHKKRAAGERGALQGEREKGEGSERRGREAHSLHIWVGRSGRGCFLIQAGAVATLALDTPPPTPAAERKQSEGGKRTFFVPTSPVQTVYTLRKLADQKLQSQERGWPRT